MIFVCWLWRGSGPVEYGVGHVHVLSKMLERHGGHELVCVTDDQEVQFKSVRKISMPLAVSNLGGYYPKLWLWSETLQRLVGARRFASIDLDVVVTGNLAECDTGEPLLFWRDAAGREPYNTSLVFLNAGQGFDVWRRWPLANLENVKAAYPYWTGDQSWVAWVLGGGCAAFADRGVVQYRPEHRNAQPANMRAAFMCGPYDPCKEATKSSWVEREWR